MCPLRQTIPPNFYVHVRLHTPGPSDVQIWIRIKIRIQGSYRWIWRQIQIFKSLIRIRIQEKMGDSELSHLTSNTRK